ncbi:hypothetical protein Cgig2_009174 [Carnegiea gigantea]|uniref:Cellulose synthase-like protein G2 n=1 Tax=Carnegiea gigantea TaxID=171969 RepID=A0A9Q1KEZ7_9CARY|nr:hypothetical protein Cgig2_009174 [Carnegiea gigantea]
MWVLKEPFFWFPVTRSVCPERLPKDPDLPGIDVFVCTADLEKEPTFGVMNTVISAMALDYPVEKLSVYLSDDGGASATLMVEENQNMDFIEDRRSIKEKYEAFKQRVQRKCRVEPENVAKRNAKNHPALIQVINANSIEDDVAISNPEHVEMPHLVYVAREKRLSHRHNFKAGAINVLLRVSSIMSNSPYILVLDCDMYCNDSTSARQAMCFYVDPRTPSSLGWVQYPQKFHNISETDIYDSQIRTIWTAPNHMFQVYWPGIDGLQGPIISGTNFYIRREALYGFDIHDGSVPKDMGGCFGSSNEFLKSLNQNDKSDAMKGREPSPALLKEAHFLASCTYEKGTKWGDKASAISTHLITQLYLVKNLEIMPFLDWIRLGPLQVGFRYDSVAEDVMTSIQLQNLGWRSFYLNPTRPQFLGTAPTDLNELLVQGTSIIPPLCFFYGIALYPKGIYEHYISGGSIRTWMNEQRVWMIKGASCAMVGALDCVMAKLGLKEASFIPTNKAGSEDKTKYYQMGKYDFRTSNMFLVPIVSMVSVNLACLVGGIIRVIIAHNWETSLAHAGLSFYAVVMSFPVIEGMFLRKDDGRVPLSTTIISSAIALVFLSIGYFIFLH